MRATCRLGSIVLAVATLLGGATHAETVVVKYRGEIDPSLEDFKDAEWQGEAEFDDLFDK